ncbi:MAG: GldG family protein [Pseudobdellovibrionaceae bacterium]
MKKQSVIFLLLSGISFICLLVLRFLLGGWEHYMFVPLVLFLGFLIAGLWNSRKLFREFMLVKTTKEGMSMGVMILLTFVLLAALNYLGAKKFKTFDFSSSKVNSLSEQSRTLLRSLTDDLKVLYFYQRGTEGTEDNRRAFIDLIKKYQDESPRVKLQFVEVNENPKLTEEYGVNKGSGLVFVEYKGRKNKIEKIDEQELTGALVKVTREKDKKIFFTIGHGERDFEETKEPTGMNAFKKLVEGNRYIVAPLNLNLASEVPADADLVIVAGAQHEFLDHEKKALEKYLQRGGSLILALKGQSKSGLSDWLASKVGVRISADYIAQVMDTPLGKAVNPQITPVSQFSSADPITKPFGRGDFVVMRLPSVVLKEKIPDGIVYEDLARTDANAMGFPDTNFKGAAKPGPFSVAASLKGKMSATAEKEFSMVVFADVDFLSNQLLYKNLNRDLALNTVASMAREENVISISPKEVDVTQMQITEMQFYVFIFGFIIPLPLLMLVISGTLWYRRRFA